MSVPHAPGSKTSAAAAAAIAPTVDVKRRQVYDFFRLSAKGATADEVNASLNIGRHHTTSPRVTELLDNDYVYDTGETRPTRGGTEASVFRITNKDATTIVIIPRESQVAFLSRVLTHNPLPEIAEIVRERIELVDRRRIRDV